MLRICGTAAIAKKQGFVSRAVRRHESIGGGNQLRHALADKAIVHLDTMLQIAAKNGCSHVSLVGRCRPCHVAFRSERIPSERQATFR